MGRGKEYYNCWAHLNLGMLCLLIWNPWFQVNSERTACLVNDFTSGHKMWGLTAVKQLSPSACCWLFLEDLNGDQIEQFLRPTVRNYLDWQILKQNNLVFWKALTREFYLIFQINGKGACRVWKKLETTLLVFMPTFYQFVNRGGNGSKLLLTWRILGRFNRRKEADACWF